VNGSGRAGGERLVSRAWGRESVAARRAGWALVARWVLFLLVVVLVLFFALAGLGSFWRRGRVVAAGEGAAAALGHRAQRDALPALRGRGRVTPLREVES